MERMGILVVAVQVGVVGSVQLVGRGQQVQWVKPLRLLLSVQQPHGAISVSVTSELNNVPKKIAC